MSQSQGTRYTDIANIDALMQFICVFQYNNTVLYSVL